VAQIARRYPTTSAAAELDRSAFPGLDRRPTSHTPSPTWYFAYVLPAVGFSPSGAEQAVAVIVLWGQTHRPQGEQPGTGAAAMAARPGYRPAGRTGRGVVAVGRSRCGRAESVVQDQREGNSRSWGAHRFWSRTTERTTPGRAGDRGDAPAMAPPCTSCTETARRTPGTTAGDGRGAPCAKNAGWCTQPWCAAGALGEIRHRLIRPGWKLCADSPIPSGWGCAGRLRGGPSATSLGKSWTKRSRSRRLLGEFWLLSGAGLLRRPFVVQDWPGPSRFVGRHGGLMPPGCRRGL